MLYPDGTHSHIHDDQMKKPAGSLKGKKNPTNLYIKCISIVLQYFIGNTTKLYYYLQKKSLKITRHSSLPEFKKKALVMQLGWSKRYGAYMTIKLRYERKSHQNLKQPQKIKDTH